MNIGSLTLLSFHSTHRLLTCAFCFNLNAIFGSPNLTYEPLPMPNSLSFKTHLSSYSSVNPSQISPLYLPSHYSEFGIIFSASDHLCLLACIFHVDISLYWTVT